MKRINACNRSHHKIFERPQRIVVEKSLAQLIDEKEERSKILSQVNSEKKKKKSKNKKKKPQITSFTTPVEISFDDIIFATDTNYPTEDRGEVDDNYCETGTRSMDDSLEGKENFEAAESNAVQEAEEEIISNIETPSISPSNSHSSSQDESISHDADVSHPSEITTPTSVPPLPTRSVLTSNEPFHFSSEQTRRLFHRCRAKWARMGKAQTPSNGPPLPISDASAKNTRKRTTKSKRKWATNHSSSDEIPTNACSLSSTNGIAKKKRMPESPPKNSKSSPTSSPLYD